MPGGGAGAGGFGQRNGPTSVAARALLWIVISVVFLVIDVSRLLRFRAAGLQPSWFLWAQIVLWAGALLFWTYKGVQSLGKGKVS